jgi:hypothetical protein
MDLVEIKNRKTDIARHPWELARFEIVRSLLHSHIRNDENYSVLDIGCGDIFFISSLANYYPKVNFYAVDIAFTDEIMKQLSGSINGKNIFLFKTLDEAGTHLKKPADLVLLLDVVEHIEKDVEFLSWLHGHSSVSSHTLFMITVPAYQSLFCSHDHFLGHYRRYTNASLDQTIQKAGFKKIKLGYFFFSLLLPRILQTIKEKISRPDLTKSTTGLVEWNGGSGITSFIKGVLLLDHKISNGIRSVFGRSLPGLSNYILCKKQG